MLRDGDGSAPGSRPAGEGSTSAAPVLELLALALRSSHVLGSDDSPPIFDSSCCRSLGMCHEGNDSEVGC